MRSSEHSTCNMPLISSERAGWEKSNSGYRHRASERLNDSAKVTQLKAVGLGLSSSFCPSVLPCWLPGGRTEAGSREVGMFGLYLTASFSHTLPQKERACPECRLCCVVTLLFLRRHEWPSMWWHMRQLRPCSNSSDHHQVSPHLEWKWLLPLISLTWPYSVCILTKKGFSFFLMDGSAHWAAQARLKQFPAISRTPFLRSQPPSACHSPLHSFLWAAHYLCLLAQMACLCKWRPSFVLEFLPWTE